MSECQCDARFSGVDEAEHMARGCPECICERKVIDPNTQESKTKSEDKMSQDKTYRREREIIRGEKPKAHWENSPSHCHAFIGIWDPDNEIAGETCKQCYAWNELDELKAEIEFLQSVRTSQGNMISKLRAEIELLKQCPKPRKGDLE